MELFDFPADPSVNLLPGDGIVHYYGKLMSSTEAAEMAQALLERIEWRNDEAVIYGKRIITKRKVAWYGDQPFRIPIRTRRRPPYLGRQNCKP